MSEERGAADLEELASLAELVAEFDGGLLETNRDHLLILCLSLDRPTGRWVVEAVKWWAGYVDADEIRDFAEAILDILRAGEGVREGSLGHNPYNGGSDVQFIVGHQDEGPFLEVTFIDISGWMRFFRSPADPAELAAGARALLAALDG